MYAKDRKSDDGRPFYCLTCGCGFEEYLACEEGVCILEPNDDAQARQARLKSERDEQASRLLKRRAARNRAGVP